MVENPAKGPASEPNMDAVWDRIKTKVTVSDIEELVSHYRALRIKWQEKQEEKRR